MSAALQNSTRISKRFVEVRHVLLGLVLAILAQTSRAQQTDDLTIREPSAIHLTDLFGTADAVVLVKIISGDTENYATAVYKAEVLESFKGPAKGEVLYFGPHIGSRLGWDYVLFLHRAVEPAAPKDSAKPSYGTVNVFQVFKEGYSSMETSYECVFKGKDSSESCGYAVRVCTNYIILPMSYPTFPPLREDTPFGCRWIRKESFLTTLKKFRDSGK